MHGGRLFLARHVRLIHFPHICPRCASEDGLLVASESPEVEAFQCPNCAYTWSAPAPPPMRPVPDAALPRDWFDARKKKR